MSVEIVRGGEGVEVRWVGASAQAGGRSGAGVGPLVGRWGNEVEVVSSPLLGGCVKVEIAGQAHVEPGSKDELYGSSHGEELYGRCRSAAHLDRAGVVDLIARLVACLEAE